MTGTSAQLDKDLLARVEAWRAQDPDQETVAELDALLAANDSDALRARFDSRLGFGTAGLRGELGAGPNRMNRVLVAQAAAGIAAWLKSPAALAHGIDPSDPSVVIGFDGRHKSDVFALDSARIFAAAGVRAMLFDAYCPTPMLAFAVKRLGASAGVMVTASHNPPRDNGYKVYLGGSNGGSQIVSPVDKEMAAEITTVAGNLTFDQIAKSGEFIQVGSDLRAAYRAELQSLLAATREEARKPLKVVFTAMHGVGWATFAPAFEAAGLGELVAVEQQREPDGDFPTVEFPNPEELGALDLSFARASEVGADLIIANDPDADRCAVAIPDCTFTSGWRKLTGDEVGLILGDELARRAAASGRTGALAASIVSSNALAKVAAQYGLNYRETLTGFKWVAKVPNLIFGYEEALGYCCDPSAVPDKDGVSAALVFIELAGRLAAQGKSIEHHLAELGERYGHFATGQISIRVTDLSVIGDTMARLRANPPKQISFEDARLTDLALGSTDPSGVELPPTDGLRFDLADGRRVIVRPSGTEPKLKCYLLSVGASAAAAKTGLSMLEAAMRKELAG